MTSPSKNKRSVPAQPSSSIPVTKQKQRQRTHPDPASLGFEMPAWFSTPPSAEEQIPEMRESSATLSNPLQPSPHDNAVQPETQRSPQRTVLEGMKVVCICKGIKKRVFWKALDEGVRTKNDMNCVTGSGSGGCQGRRCGPRILEMIREALHW